jgi:hypothetical protein
METSMSTAMLSAEDDLLVLEKTTYLGPATVVRAAQGRVKLQLPDGCRWAQCALAFTYQPVAGDIVLAIGHSGLWYVIGLLTGTGPSNLTVPGDLEIRAPRGRISLTAATAVELRGHEVRVSANRLEVLAETVFERLSEVTRWVKGTFQLRVGRLRTRVDGTYDVGAGRIVERARRDVKIDGEKIHLG